MTVKFTFQMLLLKSDAFSTLNYYFSFGLVKHVSRRRRRKENTVSVNRARSLYSHTREKKNKSTHTNCDSSNISIHNLKNTFHLALQNHIEFHVKSFNEWNVSLSWSLSRQSCAANWRQKLFDIYIRDAYIYTYL